MKKAYAELIKRNYNYLGYGFSHYFFSSLGQTFLISVFVKFLTDGTGIDNNQFNELYGAATIGSALILSVVGGLIDKFSVRSFSIVNGIALALFCFFISMVYSPVMLFIGLFGIRLCGQGLMPLIGSTSIARYFDKERGRALSLSSIGLSFSETIMPGVAIALIALLGWEWAWKILGLGVLGIFIPVVIMSVKGSDVFQGGKKHIKTLAGAHAGSGKSRSEVLRDPRFFILLPAVLFIPFFITGLFINHHLFESIKGWSIEWIATCFLGYGICKVLTSFLAGPLVDQYSAKKVFPYHMLPFAMGMLFLLFGQHKLSALAYLCLAGVSTSLMSITTSAMWTEIYGYKHLGAIKSMVTTSVVFASALGPKVVGVFLQQTQTWYYVPVFGFIAMLILSLVANFTLNMHWQVRLWRGVRKFRSLF